MTGDARRRGDACSYKHAPAYVCTDKCVTASPASPMRDQVRELANRVDRLMVTHRDPEAFFMERAEIAGQLRRVARSLGG